MVIPEQYVRGCWVDMITNVITTAKDEYKVVVNGIMGDGDGIQWSPKQNEYYRFIILV